MDVSHHLAEAKIVFFSFLDPDLFVDFLVTEAFLVVEALREPDAFLVVEALREPDALRAGLRVALGLAVPAFLGFEAFLDLLLAIGITIDGSIASFLFAERFLPRPAPPVTIGVDWSIAGTTAVCSFCECSIFIKAEKKKKDIINILVSLVYFLSHINFVPNQ